MKKRIGFAVLISLLFVSTGLLAQSQKIAYADIDSIAVTLPEFKQKQKELQTYGEQLNQQMLTMRNELQTKFQEYQEKEATWLPEIIQEKQKELQQLEQNLMEFQQRSQGSLQRKEQELIAPIYTKITAAIETMAKEMGYTHVMPKGMLLYTSGENDITTAVIKKLGGTQ